MTIRGSASEDRPLHWHRHLWCMVAWLQPHKCIREVWVPLGEDPPKITSLPALMDSVPHLSSYLGSWKPSHLPDL